MIFGLQEEKLALCAFGVLMLTIVAGLSIRFPAIGAVYSTFVGGVVGLAGVYCGSNVAASLVGAKFSQTPPSE